MCGGEDNILVGFRATQLSENGDLECIYALETYTRNRMEVGDTGQEFAVFELFGQALRNVVKDLLVGTFRVVESSCWLEPKPTANRGEAPKSKPRSMGRKETCEDEDGLRCSTPTLHAVSVCLIWPATSLSVSSRSYHDKWAASNRNKMNAPGTGNLRDWLIW